MTMVQEIYGRFRKGRAETAAWFDCGISGGVWVFIRRA